MWSRLAALAAVALVAACAGAPSEEAAEPSSAQETAPAAREPSGEYLYVASQSGPAVSVIDIGSLEVAETIELTELGFTPNAKPHDTAVEPDGSYWYVSLISDGRVLKFDRGNDLVGETEFETPGMLAVAPDTDWLYVGRSMAAVNPPQRIGMIDRSSMAIEELDVFFPRPHAIAVSPDGFVYSASLAENRIAALEPLDEELELVSVAGDMVHTMVQFAISPDGSTLVTGGEMSGQVLVFDLTDPLAPETVTSFELGGKPWHPTFSADGSRLFYPQQLGNSVAVIDTASWEVVETITHLAIVEPHGSALSPDGGLLFVAGRNTTGAYDGGLWNDELPMGTVVAIDTDTYEVVEVLAVPPYAAGLSTRAR